MIKEAELLVGKLIVWVQDLSSVQKGELLLLVPAPAYLAIQTHANASR